MKKSRYVAKKDGQDCNTDEDDDDNDIKCDEQELCKLPFYTRIRIFPFFLVKKTTNTTYFILTLNQRNVSIALIYSFDEKEHLLENLFLKFLFSQIALEDFH